MSSYHPTYTEAFGQAAKAAPFGSTPVMPGWIARLRGWFMTPAKDPIEQLVDAHGGVMSDAMEREIARRIRL